MRPIQHISTNYLLQTLWWPHATTELGQGTKELARFEVTCKSRKHDTCVDSASLLGGCRVRCLRLQKGVRIILSHINSSTIINSKQHNISIHTPLSHHIQRTLASAAV